jgi:hypothetical protein
MGEWFLSSSMIQVKNSKTHKDIPEFVISKCTEPPGLCVSSICICAFNALPHWPVSPAVKENVDHPLAHHPLRL